MTQEKYIEKCKLKHNDLYDYSLVEYKNSKTKIKIICNKCNNIFEQRASNHLYGNGCPFCNGGSKGDSQKKFIQKANKIHKNKYDYSLVEYKNSKTKIKIICNKCNNVFEQRPGEHISGAGCPKCSNVKYDNLSFIQKANKIHKNKYDYSLMKYESYNSKIKIICPRHGEFEQTPNNHLHGKGCPLCVGKNKTTEYFIKQLKIIHGNLYNYSLVEYKNSKTKIKIICNKCNNIFEQRASNHLYGNGCPFCKESKGEKKIKKYLNNNNIKFEEQKKFKDCKDQSYLPFDFYLPEYNLCIEFDGKQHFEIVDYFGGEEKFKIRQKHDKIKNQYCKENNIDLLRIKYDENINEELFLNKIHL